MKPFFFSLTLLSVLASNSLEARGKIENINGTFTLPEDLTIVDPTTEGTTRIGAIQRHRIDGNTTLSGNISITAADRNSGCGISNDADWLTGGPSLDSISSITLSTTSTTDKINIYTSGNHSFGILNNNGNTGSYVRVDANYGNEFQELNVIATTSNSYMYGISGWDNSVTYINAKTTVKTGYFGVYTNTGAKMYFTGTVDVTSGRGFEALGGSLIDLSKTTSTKVTSIGPALFSSGRGSKIILGEHLEAHNKTSTLGVIHATSEAEVTGTGKYLISGRILSLSTDAYPSGSKVDLTFTSGSVFDGSTAFFGAVSDQYEAYAAANNITLAFQGGSHWNLDATSTMTDLTVMDDASIMFNKGKKGALFTIDSNSVDLQIGSVLKIDVDGSLVKVGDEFRLFTGLDTLWENGGAAHDEKNAKLYSADGLWLFSYINPEGGLFRIVGMSMVPEPTTATLSLLGLAGLMIRRRR